ncbi:MAG: Gfo/Idh/MocA family oxidoreductase [FCB group bacterium]|nr:Gfo/Idh/MocA family oxidoreductase [FCB group bacterium]
MARIGIISFAHMHAYSYAESLNQTPNAEFVAAWDADAKRGKAAAQQFGVKFAKDLDAFLKSDIDAVIICSENVRHREHVEKAAKAGKWILCEKPLATNIEDAKAMVAACKKAGVGLGTAFPVRYCPPVMEARDRIASGEMGKVIAASCTNNGSFPGGWFADPALSGGGAVMDHTVHVADAMRWILGREFAKVYCESGTFFAKGIKVDDVGSLHLETEDGIIVSHIASWNRPASFPTWGDVTLEIICENGVVNVDAFNQKVNVYNNDRMKAEWAYWGANPDTGLVADFITAVDERREPPVTGVDGLRAVEVTVAALKSAETGRMVKV